MAKTGWKRYLGTSKREQGIETPRAPKPPRGEHGMKGFVAPIDYSLDFSLMMGKKKTWWPKIIKFFKPGRGR